MLDEEIRKIHDTAPFGSKLLVISVSHFDGSFLFERIESKKKNSKKKSKKRERNERGITEIKEKWKLHDRAEDCVKVIRHNLAFREMAATTPSTNLVRHLYLARHFPRQKVVKINEYQCPQALETGRLFEIHPRFRGPQVIPSSGSFR